MPESLLTDIRVSKVSLVGRAAVRDYDSPGEPMRFLVFKAEEGGDSGGGGAATAVRRFTGNQWRAPRSDHSHSGDAPSGRQDLLDHLGGPHGMRMGVTSKLHTGFLKALHTGDHPDVTKAEALTLASMVILRKADWDSAYQTALPDSAFAYVKTVNGAKVRKLPYRDSSGKVDLPHLRNALARANQSGTELGGDRDTVIARLEAAAAKSGVGDH